MNDFKNALIKELLEIYWVSKDFLKVNSIFDLYRNTDDSIICLSKLKSAFSKCGSPTDNIQKFLFDSSRNGQEILDIMLEMWDTFKDENY